MRDISLDIRQFVSISIRYRIVGRCNSSLENNFFSFFFFFPPPINIVSLNSILNFFFFFFFLSIRQKYTQFITNLSENADIWNKRVEKKKMRRERVKFNAAVQQFPFREF